MPVNPESLNPESQNRETSKPQNLEIKYKARLDKARMIFEGHVEAISFTIPEVTVEDEVLEVIVNKNKVYEFFAESVILAIVRTRDALYVLEYSEVPLYEHSGCLGLWEIPLEVAEE